MAKQLFFRTTVASVHRGNNDAKLNNAASWWTPYSLSEVRGTFPPSNPIGMPQPGSPTVVGPTNGVELNPQSGSGVPIEWISEPLSADFTISGTVTGNIWAAEGTMNDNSAINFVVDKIDGATGVITQIVKSARVTELGTGTPATVSNFTAAPTSTACKRGDRLRVRLFGDDAGTMAATGTTVAWTDGNTAGSIGDSYIQFTENLTFEPAGDPYLALQQADGASSLNLGKVTGGYTGAAQAFVADVSAYSEVRMRWGKTGAPTDSVVIEIQTDAANIPSGTVVATIATLAGTSLTTSVIEYAWAASLSLSVGVKYWLVIRRTGATSDTDFYNFATATGSAPAGWTTFKIGPPTWTGGGGTSFYLKLIYATPPSTYYLTDTAETINPGSATEKKALKTRGSGSVTSLTWPVNGPTSGVQITATGGGTAMEWYTPPLNAVTLGGKAKFNIRALSQSAPANASLKAEIAIVAGDGTGATVWGGANVEATTTYGNVGELDTASEHAYFAWVSGDDTAITAGQRLRFRIYLDDCGDINLVGSGTVNVTYSGTTAAAAGDTYVILPAAVTEQVLTTPVSDSVTVSYNVVSRVTRTLALSYNITRPTVLDHYSSTILADNPIAYFRLGEVSGTVAVNEKGDPGTYTGNPTLNQPGITGNPAVGFDGGDDKIDLPASLSIPAGSSITVEWWQYFPSGPGLNGTTFSIGNTDTPNKITGYSPWGDNSLYWDYGDYTGGSGRVALNYDLAWKDKWTLVQMTFDAATGKHAITINGVEVASHTNANAPIITLSGGYIGQWQNYYFKATLDEFAIYNYALTPTQRLAHYTARPVSKSLTFNYNIINTVAGFPHAGVVDDFNRANQTPPGSSWVPVSVDQTYDNIVLADSPRFYLKCDESTGDLYDVVINGSAFNYGGGPPDGLYGQSEINPNNTGTSIATSGLNTAFWQAGGYWVTLQVNDVYTQEMWIKRRSTTDGQAQSFWSRLNGGFGFFMNADGTWGLFIPYAGWVAYTTAGGAITDTNPHHLVIARNGPGNVHLYKDGVEAPMVMAQPTWGVGDSVGYNLYLGNDVWNFPYSNIYMDDIALYASQLSADRVATHYRGGVVPRNFGVYSNQLHTDAAGLAKMDWSANSAAEEELYATLVGIGADGKILQLHVRRNVATNTSYFAQLTSVAAGNDKIEIFRRVNGVDTLINVADTTQNFAAGDGFGLHVKDVAITAFKKPGAGAWTQITQRVDSVITAGGITGIVADDPSWVLEDFGFYRAGLSVTKTLTVNYGVSGKVPVTALALSYNVRKAIVDTVSPSYIVKKIVAKTLAPSYNVRRTVTNTLSVSYNVKRTVVDTVTPSYIVKRQVPDSQTFSYGVAGRVPAKTLALSYIVKKIVAQTLAPSYIVKKQLADAQSFSYTVRAAIVKTLAPSYNVKQRVAKTLALTYNVSSGATTPVAKALSVSYNVKRLVVQAASFSYNVKRQIADSQAFTYNVRAYLTKTLTPSYAVRKQIVQAQSVSYNVRAYLTKTLIPVYNVKRQVPDSQSFSYTIRNQIPDTLPLTYTVRAFVTKTSTASYTVRKFVSQTRSLAYTVVGRITKTLTPTYNVRKQIVKTQAFTYNLLTLGAVSKQLSLSYNVRVKLVDSQSFSYFVRTVVPVKTLALSYTVRKAIPDTLSVSYTVRAYVTDTQSLSYIVRAAVTKALATSYTVRRAILDSQSFSYNIISLTGVLKNLALSYFVRKQVPDTLSLSYTVRRIAADAQTFSYNVKQQIPDSQAFSYTVRKLVAKTATFSYTVTKANITKTFTSSYLIRTRVTNTLAITYTVKKIVTRIRLYSYNIRQLIVRPLTINYIVKQRTAKSLALIYNIGSAEISPTGKLTITPGATGYMTVTINGLVSTEVQPAIGTTTTNGITSSLTVRH